MSYGGYAVRRTSSQQHAIQRHHRTAPGHPHQAQSDRILMGELTNPPLQSSQFIQKRRTGFEHWRGSCVQHEIAISKLADAMLELTVGKSSVKQATRTA